ncbi:hypothetical protein [Viscerimonas tarda]
MKKIRLLFLTAFAAVSLNGFSQAVGDALVYDASKYYQIFSFGTDEGKNVDNPKYLYAVGDLVKWVEVTDGDLTAALAAADIDVTATYWKLAPSGTGKLALRTASEKYIVRGNIPYADGTAEIASALIGETRQPYSVLFEKVDSKNSIDYNTYSIRMEVPDGEATKVVGMEVNNGNKESASELEKTVQFNNTVADRPRWRWVFVETDIAASVESVVADSKVAVSKAYYDLTGRPVAESAAKGILIQKSVYEDGTSAYSKVYIK